MATNVEIHSPVKGLHFLSPDRVRVYQKGEHNKFDAANAPPAAIAEINCHWGTNDAAPEGAHKQFFIFPNDVIVINKKRIAWV